MWHQIAQCSVVHEIIPAQLILYVFSNLRYNKMQNNLQCLIVQYNIICETVNTGIMQSGKIKSAS